MGSMPGSIVPPLSSVTTPFQDKLHAVLDEIIDLDMSGPFQEVGARFVCFRRLAHGNGGTVMARRGVA